MHRDDNRLINVFDYRGRLSGPATGTVFHDAAALGFRPIALTGDLEPLDCTWRDLLLQGAERLALGPFYAAMPAASGGIAPSPDPSDLRRSLGMALSGLLRDSDRPCLVWTFIDVDLYIHRHGYDSHVLDMLAEIGRLAAQLTHGGALVVAHSDHGLVETTHDDGIEAMLTDIQGRHGCAMGGAGRTRWLYGDAETSFRVAEEIAVETADAMAVMPASRRFRPGSLAAERCGSVLLIASGRNFLAPSGYCFEHGSETDGEIHVPFSVWDA